MQATRAGAPSRLKPFSAPHYVGFEGWFFNIFLGLLVPVGIAAAVLASSLPDVRAFLDADHPLHRLGGAGAGPDARGRVFVSGRVEAMRESLGVPPLCYVVHQHYVSGKGGGWRTDYRDTWNAARIATSGDGRAPSVAWLVTTDCHWEPAIPRRVPAHDAAWRMIFPSMPSGGRVLEHCAPAGGRVHIEATSEYESLSAGERTLGGVVTITTGDGTPQRRIDWLAAEVAGAFAQLAIPLAFVLAYGWLLVRARPLAAALVARAGLPPQRSDTPRYAVAVATPVAVWLALAAATWLAPAGSWLEVPRSGYAVVAAVVGGLAVVAIALRARRATLDAAMKPVLDAPTVPLARANGRTVEVAARVREAAPVTPGPLSGRPHAWWRVVVWGVFQAGKNYDSRVVSTTESAPVVPIEDGSSKASLDLGNASLDVRAYRQRVPRRPWTAATKRTHEALLARLPTDRNQRGWLVEEWYLDPGEAVYVLGDVERVADPGREAGYRVDPTLPVFEGKGAPLVVHAGTERSLLGALALERRYVGALAVAATALPLALGALALYLASR